MDETTGVGTEQPAAPSEPAQVESPIDAATSDTSQAENAETVVTSEPVTAEEPEWIEPSEFGSADDTKIPFDKKAARKLYFQVADMGGEAVFDAVRGIGEDLVSGQPDGVRLAHKIHALNPDAYQQLGQVLLDATLEQKFGKGVTFDMVEQALSKPAVPQEETYEDQPQLPPEVEARLKKLDELESKVGKYDEAIEREQKQAIAKFGDEIITEAMSPLGKLFEDAGLKVLPNDSPEEIEEKSELASAIYERAYKKVYNDPNNKAIVDETEAGIQARNPLLAKKHMLKLQARVEREAIRQIKIFTGRRASARNLQTQNLNNETPQVVPGNSGAQAFATRPDNTPAFDESRAEQVFQDILARQGVSS